MIISNNGIRGPAGFSGTLTCFEEYRENLIKRINELTYVSNSFLEDWDGEDAQLMIKKINEEVIPAFTKYYDILITYIEFLRVTDDAFIALEETYSKKINV